MYCAFPNNAHIMSKRLCGLDKYFGTKRRLVEDREGSSNDSAANSSSSYVSTTEEVSLIETSSIDSALDSTIEEQFRELDNETAMAINDIVSYS